MYHNLRPHPALAPLANEQNQTLISDQQQSYSAYVRLLAQGIIAVVLPTEDLQNPCLRALVSEVSADLIIGNFVGNRICQSMFLFDSIRKATTAAQNRLKISDWAFDIVEEPKDRLSSFGLISSQNKIESRPRHRTSVPQLISIVAHYCLLAFSVIRGLVKILATSPNLPNRQTMAWYGRSQNGPVTPITFTTSAYVAGDDDRSIPHMTPVMSYRFWSASGSLASFSLRMPWLSGMVSLIQFFLVNGRGKFGRANSVLDRYVRQISL